MKQGDLAIMVVRQLADAYHVINNTEIIVRIGNTYTSDTVPGNFYETAAATLGHHPWPYAKKYLEVRLLSEPVPVVKNDVRYIIADEFEVVREIPLEELRQNSEFDAACVENEKRHEDFQAWFKNEMEGLRSKGEAEEKLFEKRYKKMRILVFLPLVLVVVFYFLLPLCLSWLGVL